MTHGQKLSNEIIQNIAKKHKKIEAQVLIRFGLQHGCVVIPKSVHKNRIEENLNVFDFELSNADMEALNALNENLHFTADPTNLE